MYIYFKTKLIKHEFEDIVGTTRDKQHIVKKLIRNMGELLQQYNTHINLKTYIKARR